MEAMHLKLTGWSCQAIANHFNVTRQRASQMVHQAMRRLDKEPEAIDLIPEEYRDGIKALLSERRKRAKRKKDSLIAGGWKPKRA